MTFRAIERKAMFLDKLVSRTVNNGSMCGTNLKVWYKYSARRRHTIVFLPQKDPIGTLGMER